MQETITRKIFGQAISYQLQIEECQRNQYQIYLSCLQPRLYQQMLGSSPALLQNQLVTIVKDAAYKFTTQIEFQEPFFIDCSQNEVCLQARFSTR
ncbi:hypothetical protein GXP67_31270 [Rhodocytophaga rosea]|uniref:Uncharacterized protein n=1 Tax=Rhodocytophaga rosea TaxID=2704465 RepID=A0A6C0GTF3_9BACT|nr:hypothetical protein [Rhodocytophaga rosea]QHT70813.1 hypothetical protein GXP67_31270 [Rhodocytophaga rosea]